MKKDKLLASEIMSDYDRDENFTVNNVPEHFESVTNESLAKLKRSTIEKIENGTNLKPGSLKMALRSVDGQFEEAYNTLEGDYSDRKAKLQAAYTQGVSDLRKAFKNFELQVEEHNIAFQNYSAANKALNGSPLSDNLEFSKEDLRKMKDLVDSL